MSSLRRVIWSAFVYMSASIASAFVPTEDGLYAVFDTSLGEFAVELYYEQVPNTVGNFVGLATGSKASFDTSTGEISNAPFYDGITFHRVVTGFVIQAGSPNGQGTDGPGYTFADEFVPELRHDAEGVLSMANSGEVDSNGSQFFVTLRATPELDGVHSVFGRIVDGIETVRAIGTVSRDPTVITPPEAVVINTVEIVRVGVAAEAWDPLAVELPTVHPDTLRIGYLGDGTVSLNAVRPPFRQIWIFAGRDLGSWSRVGAWDIESEAVPDFSIELLPTAVTDTLGLFVRRVDVYYPQ